jgi:hypothetical protein
MKIPHTQVFVRNTKVYIPTWYLVFLLFTNTSFKHTVEHVSTRYQSILHENVDSVTYLAKFEDLWVV